MLKNKLDIILITYNRKDYLERTLNQILEVNSPIRDYDITILDNASTDGTSELIQEYCSNHNNIKHIRHKKNIGGNANICRAFEMGSKEYIWVICDDDKYDFSSWSDVETEINKGTDIICLANYFYESKDNYNKPEYQIPQLTFVPSGIYKTELITNDVLINMYDSIYTMFPQACICIKAINDNKKMHVLENPIVFNGLHYEDACSENSYIRGCNNNFVLKRKADTNWILGFSNIITLLNNEKLMKLCFETAIQYKDIYTTFDNFYNCMYYDFLNFNKFNYFLEIYKLLNIKRKKELLIRVLWHLSHLEYIFKIWCELPPDRKIIKIKLFNCLKIKLWDSKWCKHAKK